ncbi:MAG: hypothetical protein KTR21_02750 [Rhodobacteraceae bacterium]|nr:hypothetical protein [Paracoccaceae bacterium]
MDAVFSPTAIFKFMAVEPAAFAGIRVELRKQAVSLFEKAMKSKAFTAEALRATLKHIGEKQFVLSLGCFKAATLCALVKKFDPNHPKAKVAAKEVNTAWAKQRILEIAQGAEPTEQAVPLDKLLPAKERTPAKLAALRTELGEERFAASLAAMSPSAPKGFAKKLDPKHPKARGAVKTIDAAWARRRIAEIAGCVAAPELTVITSSPLPPERLSARIDSANWYDELVGIYRAGRERSTA